MGKRKRRLRYSKEVVLEAIEGSMGIISQVAKRLGCQWDTARQYIERWEETRQAYKAEREKVLDVAEAAVLRAIKDGDVGAAKWVLSRLGRERGYGESVDISTGEGPIHIVLKWDDKDASSD